MGLRGFSRCDARPDQLSNCFQLDNCGRSDRAGIRGIFKKTKRSHERSVTLNAITLVRTNLQISGARQRYSAPRFSRAKVFTRQMFWRECVFCSGSRRAVDAFYASRFLRTRVVRAKVFMRQGFYAPKYSHPIVSSSKVFTFRVPDPRPPIPSAVERSRAVIQQDLIPPPRSGIFFTRHPPQRMIGIARPDQLIMLFFDRSKKRNGRSKTFGLRPA